MDILDPDAAHEQLAAWKDRIDQVAANTAAMSERLQELRVTARDRMAEVTVDSTGKLVELRLTEEIHRAAPDVVARTVMATLRNAQGQLAARTSEIITGTVGADSTTGQAVAASYNAPTGQAASRQPAASNYGAPAPTHTGAAGSLGRPATGRPVPAHQPSRRPEPPVEDDVDVSVTDSPTRPPAHTPPPRRPRPPIDDDDDTPVSVTEEG